MCYIRYIKRRFSASGNVMIILGLNSQIINFIDRDLMPVYYDSHALY
jgi:hypothetical protein